MNLFRFFVYGILFFTMPIHSAPIPLPVPKTVRIESAERRKEVWNRLSQQEKQLAFHLLEAARLGKELLFHQNHRHGRTIKRFIETALSSQEINKTKTLLGKNGFQEFVVYSAKFLDQSGPYASSNRKYILSKVSEKQLNELIKRHLVAPSLNDLTEIKKLLIDPEFEVERQPEDPKGSGLEMVGGNLYEKGIAAAEVQAALANGLESTLNCRIIKRDGKLQCEKQTTGLKGFVGSTLREIIDHLKKAEGVSVSQDQKNQIKATIRYFEKGDIEDFREANIAWVKDRSRSPVDFMMGWVEVYEDYLAKIGSWETYVQVVDPEVSKVAQALATHAQHFEDGMPYGKFKKTFPKDYSPPAIMVYYFQEISSYRTGGYNLPNFDDIRRDVGAKNVIRLPLPGESQSPDIRAIWNEVLEEFGPPGKKDALMKAKEKVNRVMVLLHEIIGHGSGTYDESKFKKNEDPISALGSLASALEEQRADLTALVFAGDPALIEVGLYKDQKEAQEMLKAQYDLYLVDFLRRTSGQRTFTEAHQRGHWLFVNKLLEKGAAEWVSKNKQPKTNKNQILRVKDYEKFHQVAVDLLGELQGIKANREEQALVKLFDTYAPLEAIKEPWAQAIIERGKDLKINAGYVEQPWRVNSQLVFESFGGTSLESIAPFFEKMNAETSHVEKI
jgi:dipeptidyl-peptidase-3